MNNREIQFLLTLKDKFSAEWSKATAQVSASVAKMQAQLGQVKGWVAGAFSVAALRTMEQEFLKAEEASAGLAQQLSKVGAAARQLEFEKMAKDLQNVTRFSDEAVMSAQRLVLGITQDVNATKELTPLILDLATAMNISIEQAAKMVAKTNEGQKSLQRLGIDVGKTSNEQERLAKITQELETRFGGAAVAAGKTAAGLAEIRKNKFSDLLEDFGRIINTGLEPFSQILAVVVDMIKAAPASIQTMVVAVGLLTAAFYALNVPLGGVPLLIGAIVTAGAGLIAWAKEGGKSIEQVTSHLSELESQSRGFSAVSELVRTYETLTAKTKLSAAEHAQLKRVIADIAAIVPEAVNAFDTEGRAIGVNTAAVHNAITARTELLRLQQEQIVREELAPEIEKQARALLQAGASIANYRTAIVELNNANRETITGMDRASKAYADAKTSLGVLIPALSGVVNNVKDFEQVAPVLVRFGLSANLVASLRNKWSELSATVGVAKTSIAEATDESAVKTKAAAKVAADSITGLNTKYSELMKAINATSISDTSAIVKLQKQATETMHALVNAERAITGLSPIDFTIRALPPKLPTSEAIKLPAVLSYTDTDIGSINNQNRIVATKREELNSALSDSDRSRIQRELQMEEAKLAQMQGMSRQYIAMQRQLWAEQNELAMVAINSIGAGYRTLWSEVVVGHRQAKDEGDAIWLAIRNTALNAIGEILTRQLEAAIINAAIGKADVAAHVTNEATKTAATESNAIARVATTVWEGIQKAATWVWETATFVGQETARTAVMIAQSAIRVATVIAEGAAKAVVWAAETAAFIAKEVAMTASFLAQQAIRVAAMLVELAASIARAVASAIAALGPVGLLAAAGIIAAGVGVVKTIKTAFGFSKGGQFEPGQRGFIEGGQTEIIAPKKTFLEIIRQEIIPIVIQTARATPVVPLKVTVAVPDLRVMSEALKSSAFVTPSGALRNFTPPAIGGSTQRAALSERTITTPRSAERFTTNAGIEYDFTRLESILDTKLTTLTQRIEQLEETLQGKDFAPVFTNFRDDEEILRKNFDKTQAILKDRRR